MADLWLFNPENDIALASGVPNFTAPPSAVDMRRAGEMLPFFLAADCDAVICNGVNDQWFSRFRSDFGINADVWDHSPEGFTPRPWGWSAAARRYFENCGFSPTQLPSDEALSRWRMLSHRRTAARLRARLASTTDLPLWPAAAEVSDAAILRPTLAAVGQAVIKQPWSSSGRGVKFYDFAKMSSDSIITQTLGTIRHQGSVMVEKYMPDHRDFALLFECSGGKAVFAGSSVFITDPNNGRYVGNLAAPGAHLFESLHSIIPSDTLDSLIEGLAEALSEIVAEDYNGPVGIDICYNGHIHICEINLRYTMGFVAAGIAARLSRPMFIQSGTTLPFGAVALTPPGCRMKFFLTEKS